MPVSELAPDRLRRHCDPASFAFSSTAELEPLGEVLGQERAVRALAFGIDMTGPGYHIFALGPSGTGKMTTIIEMLQRRAKDRPAPDDWCYVTNFADENAPRALRLPAGMATRLKADVDELIATLEQRVPRAFMSEQYQKEVEKVGGELRSKQQELFEKVVEEAEAKSFRIMQTEQGIVALPVVDGEAVPPAKVEELPDEQREQLEKDWEELQQRLREANRQLLELQREAQDHLRELSRQLVLATVAPPVTELKRKYRKQPNVVVFLDDVEHDAVDRVQEFAQAMQRGGQQASQSRRAGDPRPEPEPDRYRINVVVDNGRCLGAPVVVERNPTPRNLVGAIEHESEMGTLVTDFSMIRGGALHRANGGYLLVEARDVLLRPFSWGILKRVLQDRQIVIESIVEEYKVAITRTLRPEPIPLEVKVILVGDQHLFSMLYALDPEFRELFKVKADFNLRTDWDEEMARRYACFVGDLCRKEELPHFDPSGVARLVEHASRLAADQRKLATTFGELVDTTREAAYWTRQEGRELVSAADVERAIQEKVARSNRIEELIREAIADGTILIDTDGEVTGQVNGLAVTSLGDYDFGKPSRITARVHLGKDGVVNIDRETKLGGPIHNKGVLILGGFLGARYATRTPLALSATITFEQSYGGVEGDSASSTELYALLSELSGYPIRQGIAVTGSVNQRGQVQAIGGANEKIEGYFAVCEAQGLTGDQGVLIPAANVKNLVLRANVVDAVRAGRFHIWAVEHVDEGIEILTGRPAGEPDDDRRYPEGSVNRAVQDRLVELAERGRRFAKKGAGSDQANDS